ncbi:chitin synthase [Capronia coronata CBS 617.96]|uniref:chitin synthase n=1 Tax=Capronia coronata CBS 617.96 TaxID=1182541 RepID=W9XRS7_9EURO|nr:chitin synthase [Capronia coronata CBS 617.96]EXJ83267.1 chitin synthase [Capronia coronata CBS 617.96]
MSTQRYETGPWSTPDIVCAAVIGPLIAAAFLESVLWVAAFCYCLVKAYQKADHVSSKILAGFLTVVFVVLRGIFLPVMLVTLPLPSRIVQYFPEELVAVLQKFAFYSFAAILIVPWLFCVYRIVIIPLGRKKLVKYTLDERIAPKVVVVMPVYKEPPESLWAALNSVVHCDYPAACIHVFLSFDGDGIDELYLKTLDRLGIPVTLKDFPKSIDVAFHGARVTVSRFPHGGKRHCQKATFLLIDKIYKRYLQRKDDLFILFIDSDCVLDPVCIQNFMYDMELKPGAKRNMLAMTGIITSCTKKNSFLTLMQDMEYVHGQLFERSVESGCGAVTCLPGALTLLRFSAFRNMAKFYFSDRAEECEDLFDYAKTHLGEDRWLTHLFMLGAKERYQIQLSTSAFCKTEAVQTFRSLLKQRRRWFLGFITNEVCMMTDARLWRKYPMLCLLRFMTVTIRTTALLFLVTIIAVATTSSRVERLPWEFMCISCGLNWMLMLYFAIRLHRWKAVLYPIMFMLNPFMNWVYMVYGVLTAGQRTWGGPRADAGAADAKVSPQEAIEYAIATGDDLNVVPETFKPAMQVRRRRTRPSALQPSSCVEGRFVPSDQDSSLVMEKGLISPTPSDLNIIAQLRRREHDSLDMSDSEDISVHTPQRIGSVSGEDYMLGVSESSGSNLPRFPSMPGGQRSFARESYYSAQGAPTTGPASQRQQAPTGMERLGRTTSPSVVVSEAELQQLREIAARYESGERRGYWDSRSPLGRISPLTALPVDEEMSRLQGDHYDGTDDGNGDGAGYSGSGSSRRKRLRKSSRSPSHMV